MGLIDDNDRNCTLVKLLTDPEPQGYGLFLESALELLNLIEVYEHHEFTIIDHTILNEQYEKEAL